MNQDDSFVQNIKGVQNLIGSSDNKTVVAEQDEEGVEGEYVDILKLEMDDEELIRLRDTYELRSSSYTAKTKVRQELNKKYYKGCQNSNGGLEQKVIASNLIFESVETFIPQSLAKNPEPVVFSDDTDEGKQASNDIKTMLQYHADTLCLRKKLGVMVRQWSTDFIGVVKYGWNAKLNEIELSVRRPRNFVFDPDGYINEFGDYKGDFLGERIPFTAKKLIEMYPENKDYLILKCNGKLGTTLIVTEWWNDDYCFTTFLDIILDKHKNEFFNHQENESDEEDEATATPAINHFAVPKMPYTFLSVFSLQEEPLDITNLVEQSIANQDRITDRDLQISKNLASANNGVVIDPKYFTAETASQAVDSFYEEGFILGDPKGVVRLPANEIPSSIFKSQENDKETLRSVFGVQGLAPQSGNEQGTARGMILNQSHDSSRIGGGVGDALEQVADNVFNWLLQLYCVFYDTPHYGAIMGNGRAVEYVSIINSQLTRKFVVSVSPNSMKPRDEISQINFAIERWNNKAIDPISFMKEINDADPMQSAKKLVLWTTNPQAYSAMYFPENAPPAQAPQQGQLSGQPGTPPENPSEEPANASLSNVPLNSPPQQ